jgi:hypothetical protein
LINTRSKAATEGSNSTRKPAPRYAESWNKSQNELSKYFDKSYVTTQSAKVGIYVLFSDKSFTFSSCTLGRRATFTCGTASE